MLRPSKAERMRTADVVIIGGGIVGSSVAYHLTAAGCKNVLVLERDSSQGKGSTGKSMGGVRAQFSTPVNIQMSLYSIPSYASFDQRLEPIGHRVGCGRQTDAVILLFPLADAQDHGEVRPHRRSDL